MTLRNFLILFFALALIIWLSGASMPYKLKVLEEAPRISYDTFITSQEYLLEKQLDQLQRDKSSTGGQIIDLKEKLANVLWSMRKFDPALKQYKNVLAARQKWSHGYDEKLVNTMISMAGLYRDMDMLDDSIDYYEKIWRLDKANLPPNDIRLERDQSSMAVMAYVCGEIQHNDKKHEQYMNNCIAHINMAQDILKQQKTSQPAKLANLLYLKSLAFRSLNQKLASKECRRAADYLTKKQKRPIVLPWT